MPISAAIAAFLLGSALPVDAIDPWDPSAMPILVPPSLTRAADRHDPWGLGRSYRVEEVRRMAESKDPWDPRY